MATIEGVEVVIDAEAVISASAKLRDAVAQYDLDALSSILWPLVADAGAPAAPGADGNAATVLSFPGRSIRQN